MILCLLLVIMNCYFIPFNLQSCNWKDLLLSCFMHCISSALKNKNQAQNPTNKVRSNKQWINNNRTATLERTAANATRERKCILRQTHRKSLTVAKFLKSEKVILLPHPPNRPDLAPSIFVYLFSKIEKAPMWQYISIHKYAGIWSFPVSDWCTQRGWNCLLHKVYSKIEKLCSI